MTTPRNDDDKRREAEFLERTESHWALELFCVFGLVFVLCGGIAECSGVFDPPPAPVCREATP
jgi:hypothetical protein